MTARRIRERKLAIESGVARPSPPGASFLTSALIALALPACASGPGPEFPPRPPLWRDDDRHPFEARLAPFYSPHDWDRIEKSLVRPVSELLAVRARDEAINVNAFDEALDSSWYENRVSRFALSPADLARGPCDAPGPDTGGPWLVTSAKPDGATPGFVFKAPSGQRFLAKFDALSSPRASLADVLASRLYHAAGYHVPCNSIVHFDPGILQIREGAEAETESGEEVPLTVEHLNAIFERASRLPDGRYRSMVSTYLPGRPLGPWRYHGRRPDDRNDIIPHEDRRELRGSRLLAAWTDHVDQREGNTLSMWHETAPGQGFIEHHLLDFGDCFGSVWSSSAQEARRRGHDYWLDPRTILADFVTLGMIERPWDRARLGRFGLLLGYYDIEEFDPERWRSRYPNPAFVRMTERDAAWMARIIARLSAAHIEQMLDEAQPPVWLRGDLLAIVLGRREKILRRYLSRLSPLAEPEIVERAGHPWLCATDLSVTSGTVRPPAYEARISAAGEGWTRATPQLEQAGHPCVPLPIIERASRGDPARVVVEIGAVPASAAPAPIRFHLYTFGANDWLTAGIDRS